MRRATIVGAALVVAVTAGATTGGPHPVEVLGWDGAARRVYVQLHSWDAGDTFGPLVYFDLAGPEPTRSRVVEWSLGGGEGSDRDPERRQNLATLRRRLQPLVPEPAPVLPFEHTVVREDTLALWSGPVPRWRVRASWHRGLAFEMDAFREPTVMRAAVWRIPGRTERLWVIAWVGDPQEGGYEVQRPVLVRADESGVRSIEGGATGE